MDTQPVITPTTPVEKNTDPLKERFQRLTKNKKARLVAAMVVLIALIGGIWLFNLKNPAEDTVIATVNKVPIPQQYLSDELKYYPATKSAETEKMLTQKLINDELTLQYGKEKGWLPQNADITATDASNYILRTNQVQQIKKQIEAEGDGISGSLVAIWFRNNGYVGPQGLAKGKQIAFSKISPLYQKVKNKEITIEEAGKTIAEDISLKEIDPSYDSNAIAPFRVKPSEQITFWPNLDQMLRNTKPGELTTLYLGQGPDDQSKMVDELYIFGQVDKTEGGKGYSSYEQWLEKQRQSAAITQLSYNAVLDTLVSLISQDEVLADDNGNDNNFHGTPAWKGSVTTATGAPVPGAILTFSNPCAGVTAQNPFAPDYVGYADGSGNYNQPPMPYINCGCNPNSVKAYVRSNGSADAGFLNTAHASGEVLCSSSTSEVRIPNQVASVTHDIICNPPNLPSPPPSPPPPACNASCTNSSECALNPDGCTSCLPNPNGGGNTCQTPPPVCGASCTQASDCARNVNGCTDCVPNSTGSGSVCAAPPACGTSCVRDDQCGGAATRDGCTACLPNSTGTGSVCAKPPACNNTCERDSDCAGAVKDGCTVCAPNANGVKTCQEPFDEGACKCDGFNALNLQNPTNSNFQFEAFGKVEGANVNKAAVKSIQFQMTKSTKSNPNAGTVIASSDVLTPQIVSSTSDKVRYRSTWSVTPPAYDPNGVYRVFANIKCDRKFASKSASLNQTLGATYDSDSNQIVEKELNYSPVRLAQSNNNLELGTLSDGYFTKITETDSCRFIRFEYGQY